MMRIPDGYVFTIKADRFALRISEPKELVTCAHCWKGRDLDKCPMADYWKSHPAESEFFCAYGESR